MCIEPFCFINAQAKDQRKEAVLCVYIRHITVLEISCCLFVVFCTRVHNSCGAEEIPTKQLGILRIDYCFIRI